MVSPQPSPPAFHNNIQWLWYGWRKLDQCIQHEYIQPKVSENIALRSPAGTGAHEDAVTSQVETRNRISKHGGHQRQNASRYFIAFSRVEFQRAQRAPT